MKHTLREDDRINNYWQWTKKIVNIKKLFFFQKKIRESVLQLLLINNSILKFVKTSNFSIKKMLTSIVDDVLVTFLVLF